MSDIGNVRLTNAQFADELQAIDYPPDLHDLPMELFIKVLDGPNTDLADAIECALGRNNGGFFRLCQDNRGPKNVV